MAEARTCTTPGCLRSTREGKAHCSIHVLSHPYVRRILAQLDARKAEEEQEIATATGVVAQEIMVALDTRNGVATIERIALMTRINIETLTSTVEVMKKRKRVTTGRTNRGRLVVRIKEKR